MTKKKMLPDDMVGASQLAVKSKLESEHGRRAFKLDGHQGLTLHARGDGSGSWMLRYRVLGKQREHVLHNDARKAVLADVIDAKDKWLARVKLEGIDPKSDLEAKAREHLAASDTFGVLFDDWLERHAKPNKKSWLADEVLWNRHVQSRMANLVPADIRRAQLVTILDDIARAATPKQANKCQSLVSAVFSWAVNSGRLETSPAYRVPKRAKETPRERVLSDEEVRQLWRATKAGTVIDRVLRLALITGQRRSEVCGINRSELNLADAQWTIPSARTKNSIVHRVPLSRMALAVTRDFSPDATFVFPGRGDSSTGFVSPDAVSRQMWKLNIGEPAITTHDLRRTVGTQLARMGVPKEVRASVLNHVSGARASVTDAVYNQYDGDAEKIRALRLWSLRLRNIIGGQKLHVLKWNR